MDIQNITRLDSYSMVLFCVRGAVVSMALWRPFCFTLVLNSNLCKTNEDGEPELHYIRLPRDIANDYVVLMDPIVGTGSAAMMAIRVLLDHDVKEDKIILVSLLMAECGSQGNLKPF